MRWLGHALIALGCLASVQAQAGVRTEVKIDTYKIAGDNGAALLKAMDRNGPRHGFMTRAIAQTRYTVAWDMTWAVSDGRCLLKAADAKLSINYRYPALAGKASPKLKARWTRFMVGVRRHEETHGRIARQMTAKAQRAVVGLGFAEDRYCRKTKREAMKVVGAIYADYEARQERFDATEHQPGGPVDRLVSSFVKGR